LAEALAANDASAIKLDANFGIVAHTKDRLISEATFKLIQVRKSDEDSRLISIECSFSASFFLGSPADEQVVTRFANREAKLVFWPYLRHFIADMSYRMAINHILVPLTTTLDLQSGG
jgi:preprotein translocase subunit SecB